MQKQLVINFKDLSHDENEYYFYGEELFSGVAHWFYETEELGSEMSYVNGMQDGWTRGWYKSGQLRTEKYYKKGVVNGTLKKWYENGQLELEEEIVNGELIIGRTWDESGNLISEKIYTQ